MFTLQHTSFTMKKRLLNWAKTWWEWEVAEEKGEPEGRGEILTVLRADINQVF